MNLSSCLLVFGCWMSWITCSFWGCAVTPCLVIPQSRQSKLSWNKWHSVELALKPPSSSLLNTWVSLFKWSSMDPSLVMTTSSMQTWTNLSSQCKEWQESAQREHSSVQHYDWDVELVAERICPLCLVRAKDSFHVDLTDGWHWMWMPALSPSYSISTCDQSAIRSPIEIFNFNEHLLSPHCWCQHPSVLRCAVQWWKCTVNNMQWITAVTDSCATEWHCNVMIIWSIRQGHSRVFPHRDKMTVRFKWSLACCCCAVSAVLFNWVKSCYLRKQTHSFSLCIHLKKFEWFQDQVGQDGQKARFLHCLQTAPKVTVWSSSCSHQWFNHEGFTAAS